MLVPLPCPNSRRTRSSWWTALLIPLAVSAGPTNRTIDDQWGDSVTGVLPAYSVNWNFGPNCTGCAIAPSESKAFGGTWHDTTSSNPDTQGHYVTLSFTGTAIWVYAIVVNTASSSAVTIFTNVTFQLDGAAAGTYTHVPEPESTSQYEYNVTAFSKTGLSNEHHTLVMTAVQGLEPSALLFDWAEYTYDDDVQTTTSASTVSTTSTSSGSPTESGEVADTDATHRTHRSQAGAIAGGVVGGVAFIAICFGILFFFRRRGTLLKHNEPEIVPFVSSSSSGNRRSTDGGKTMSTPASWRPGTAVTHDTGSTAQSINKDARGATPSLDHDQLSRDVQELRQQIANMRASRSLVGVAAAPSDVRPSSRAEDSELRQEMATLRAELAWLRAETESVGRSEPPPAYARES